MHTNDPNRGVNLVGCSFVGAQEGEEVTKLKGSADIVDSIHEQVRPV